MTAHATRQAFAKWRWLGSRRAMALLRATLRGWGRVADGRGFDDEAARAHGALNTVARALAVWTAEARALSAATSAAAEAHADGWRTRRAVRRWCEWVGEEKVAAEKARLLAKMKGWLGNSAKESEAGGGGGVAAVESEEPAPVIVVNDAWLFDDEVDEVDATPVAKLRPVGKAGPTMLTPTSVLDSDFDLGDLPTFSLYGPSHVDFDQAAAGSELML